MATTKVSTKLLETVGVAEGGTGATSTSAARTSLGLGTVATLDTVSVATGGTGATSASAARTALGLVIGTNVLAPGGDGSSLTGIAGGATDAEKSNIMLNAFRISVNGGLSVQNMVDGVVDEFEDETGVDTSTSTNETYDATSDLYGNNIPGGINQIPIMTSNTSPSGTATGGASPTANAYRAFDRAYNTYEVPGTTMTIEYDFGTGTIIGVYKINGRYSSGGGYEGQHPKNWTFQGSNGSGWVTLHTVTNETGWTNGPSDIRSFSSGNTTSYEEYRLNISANNGAGQTTMGWFEMLSVAETTNMTLVSNATTALAAPDDANIVIWQEDVDSVTLNTDLKAYASRDGTTYTQMTLSETAIIAAPDIETINGTFAKANFDLGDFGDGTTAKSEGLMFPNTNAGTVISVKQDYNSVVTSANVKASLWTNSGGPNTQVGGDSDAVNVTTTGEKTFTWSSSAPVLSAATDYWVVFTDQSSTGSFTTRSVADQGASYASGNNNVITSITGPGMTGKGGDLKVEIIVAEPGNATRVLTGSVDISGQPDGTSMKYKIETLNTKEQKIHAVALQWS